MERAERWEREREKERERQGHIMVSDFWLDTWVDGGTFYPLVVQRSKFSEGWIRKGEFCLEILNLMYFGSLVVGS